MSFFEEAQTVRGNESTPTPLTTYYVLFFIQLSTRPVKIAGITMKVTMCPENRKRGLSTVIELSGSERHDGVHLG